MESIDKIVLINKALGMKSNQFAKMIELEPSNYSQMKTGRRAVGDAILNKMVIHLNIKKNWFEKWDGNIDDPAINQIRAFITKKSLGIEPSASAITQDIVYVPLVNQYAYAGYLDGYNDITYMEQLPKVPFIVDREGHGNYMAFEVKGDSMNNGTEDSYLEGDRLYCREIAQHLWVTSKLHLRKWDFVIVHVEGILIKRITDHDVENHTITIHSLNDMYPDRIIDLREVKQIFNVIESVRPRRR